ncbi:MAG: ABC transporter ATP-binding protein [Alphaproteobacteria bacterium]
MSKSTVLSLKDIHHRYSEQVEVLRGVSLDIQPGEVVALMGPSGAGKSTLLHIAGLLDTCTTGQVLIAGQESAGLPDAKRTAVRRHEIGFVYQFHHLLGEFSALENIVMPQLLAGVPRVDAENRARDLLEAVKLDNRATHRPSQLSGGEQQRVAIMRALANNPKLLLADEPTGNLDTKTADSVFEEMTVFARDNNMGALIATHNPELADRMDRTIHLIDGKVV